MVLLAEKGCHFGTSGAHQVSLWSGYMCGAAHSHPSPHPISAGLQGGRYSSD